MIEFSELFAQELCFLPKITEFLESSGQISSIQQKKLKITTRRYSHRLKEAFQSYAEFFY
ncbi:MAG: hypothetical protein ACTSRE_17385 [Promethearchaeota archaeon]